MAVGRSKGGTFGRRKGEDIPPVDKERMAFFNTITARDGMYDVGGPCVGTRTKPRLLYKDQQGITIGIYQWKEYTNKPGWHYCKKKSYAFITDVEEYAACLRCAMAVALYLNKGWRDKLPLNLGTRMRFATKRWRSYFSEEEYQALDL